MKRTRVQRFIGVDARSAEELAELLTEKCEELRSESPEIKWFGERFSAVLVYTEHVEEPENAKDEFELRRETYTCGECPFNWPITDGRSRHRLACKRCKSGIDEDAPACNWFYEQLKKGEVYEQNGMEG